MDPYKTYTDTIHW